MVAKKTSITRWKVPGNSSVRRDFARIYRPWWEVEEAFSLSFGLIYPFQYPELESKVEYFDASSMASMHPYIIGMGYESLMVTALRLR